MDFLKFSLAAILLITGCSDTQKTSVTIMNSSEKQIEQLTTELYRAISFEQGEQPDLVALKGTFTENGRLINTSENNPFDLSVDDFIDKMSEQVENGQLLALSERELASGTDIFSGVAHRFSTYEATIKLMDADIVVRGINSIQFILSEGRWKVSTWAWCDENEGNPLPAKYLED